MNDQERFDAAIASIDKGMNDALEGVKRLFANIVLGPEPKEKTEMSVHAPTPEERALSKARLDAALKRWEERKAAEAAREAGGKKEEGAK